MKMIGELELGDVIESTDIYCNSLGNWSSVDGVIVGRVRSKEMCRIFRPLWKVPKQEWLEIGEDGTKPPCYLSDGEFVSCDTGPVTWGKLRDEPTHWMPFELPGLPLPKKSAEELAYEKFISERYHVHTLSPGEAKTAGAAWCAAIEFMKEQMVKKGMEHIGQAIIDSGKK